MAANQVSASTAAAAHRGRALPIAVAGVVLFWAGLVVASGSFTSGHHAAAVGGIVLVLAGGVAIGFAFAIALRGRRRWVQALVAALVVYGVLQWVALPGVTAGLVTQAPREPIPAARTLGLAGARDVAFPARDGVELGGWFVPSRNGAAVVVLHGSHGDRTDTEPHMRLLARAGFGVLAYDARGHGESGGRTNAFGWEGVDDVAGAVAFLHRNGIDRARIGALGLSMGAEEALRAAAGGVPLRAIVADGAGASTSGDERLVAHGPLGAIARSTSWLTMREVALLSGDPEPSALRDIAGRISAPTLLIASNRTEEREIDTAYRAEIPRAQLWYLPDAGHTQGLATHPRAYARRVLSTLSAL